MPEAQFDIVTRNKNGGVVFHNSGGGELTRQSNVPMTKFKIEGAHCTFQYKGPGMLLSVFYGFVVKTK